MGKLDAAAKPLLKPLVTGHPVALGRDNQRIIATWIALKTMVSEFSDRENVVSTQAERTYLMQHHAPPDNWKIWIGRHASPYWTDQFCRGSLRCAFFSKDGTPFSPDDSGLPNNTQAVTLGFGRMLAVIYSSTIVGINFNIPNEAKPYLVRIWPYERGLFWPPLVTLSDNQCNWIATAMDRTWNQMPWAASVTE